MTAIEDVPSTVTATVRRYLELVEAGSVDEILALFAPGATVEDPVGSEVRVGAEQIRELFTSLGTIERKVELRSLRVCGLEAAFQFTITFDAGNGSMRLEPIDTMTFEKDGGKITSLRSYFSATDVIPAPQ